MTADFISYVARLAGKMVLVVGDVILDEYITGRATRMSREAPVPVLELESKRYIAGGAANPSANIVSLGSRAIQVGVVGNDDSGQQLVDELESGGIDPEGIFRCDDRPTTVKTRVLAQMGLRFPQQVTRIDTLSRKAIDNDIETQITDFISQRITDVDAVLLSHYHGGLLTSLLVKNVKELCRKHDVLLAADVQGNFDQFAQMDVIKCNSEDAMRFLQRELRTDKDFSAAASTLHQQLAVVVATVITRGSAGATLATNAGTLQCPAPKVSNVFDTVGAGDTAIAVMTLALAGGIATNDALMLANYASGIVVRHFGNYAPTNAELLRSIDEDVL